QHHDAPDVEGLEALGHAAAADDLLHRLRSDLGVALEELVENEGAYVVGSQLRKRAFERAADRCPDRIDDDCFWHLPFLCFANGLPAAPYRRVVMKWCPTSRCATSCRVPWRRKPSWS